MRIFGWIIALLLGLSVLTLAGWGLRAALLPARVIDRGLSTVEGVVDKTLTPENAIYKYIAEENGLKVMSCFALVGDKGVNKLAQDYVYSDGVLEAALDEVLKVEMHLFNSLEKNDWPSAKLLRGKQQECFSCLECSNRPFSTGSPVTV